MNVTQECLYCGKSAEVESAAGTEESSVIHKEGERLIRWVIKFYNLDAIDFDSFRWWIWILCRCLPSRPPIYQSEISAIPNPFYGYNAVTVVLYENS